MIKMKGIMVQRYLAPANNKEWPARYITEKTQAWTIAAGKNLRSFKSG